MLDIGLRPPLLTAILQHDGRRDIQALDRPGRIRWARLLKRVFDFDMQHFPNCGSGELKINAAILERPVIQKILDHLG